MLTASTACGCSDDVIHISQRNISYYELTLFVENVKIHIGSGKKSH